MYKLGGVCFPDDEPNDYYLSELLQLLQAVTTSKALEKIVANDGELSQHDRHRRPSVISSNFSCLSH